MLENETSYKRLNDYLKERFLDVAVNDNGEILTFSTFEKEYNSLLNGVGIHNVSTKDFLNFFGKDVLDFLNRISTNKVDDLNVNEKVETLFLTEKGRIIDDTTLMRFDYDYVLVGNKDPLQKLQRWIEKYIISEDITIVTDDKKYFLLEIWGPQAESYLTLICGKFVDYLDDKNVINVNVEDLIFRIIRNKTADGKYYFWIFGEEFIAPRLIEYLLSNSSVFDLSLIGEKPFEAFRIRQGYPKSPNEINYNYNPYEVNLISKVSFTKGCYIGQEVIARLDTYDKVRRELVGVILEDKNVDMNNLNLYYKDELVGEVTSLFVSKEFDKIIGLAIIKKSNIDESMELVAADELRIKKFKVALTKLPMKI